jgi:hypothetical protein
VSIDLDNIEARIAYTLATLRCAAEHGYLYPIYPVEAATLVAEVERLRAEVAAERAAVVSALERWAEDGGDPWMSYCAERVKSGEHRREEEP